MKKIKRNSIFVLLLTFFIALGPYYLMFHRPGGINYIKTRPQSEWTGVITLWDYPRLDQVTGSGSSWINGKIRQFEKENPGVFIKLEPLTWERGTIKLDSAIKTGNLPDIGPIGSDYSFLSKGILEPLDQYFSKGELEAFHENAIKAVAYEGRLWAVPWMMTTYTMILNLDIFRERGVEPPVDGNWTYQEFIDKLQQLTYDSKGRGKMDHYGLNGFIQPGYYNLWGIILSDGASLVDKQGNYSFNDSEAISGVEKLLDLKHNLKVTHPKLGENSANEAWTTFYKDQNVAVFPTGTWAINVLEGLQNQGTGFEFAVVNYPVGELGRPIVLSNSVGSYGVFKQEDPKKLEMIVKFLKFLVQDQYQMELKRLGVFPVKKAVGNIYQDNKHMSFIYESLAYTEIIPPHPDWREIDEVLQRQLQQGIVNNSDAKSILTEVEARVETYIKIKDKYR